MPVNPLDLQPVDLHANEASEFIKCLAHPTRLRILCALCASEATVGALSRAVGAPMASVSRQLSILRADGLIAPRRSKQSIFYRLANERVSRLIETLAILFCPAPSSQDRAPNQGDDT